MSVSQNETKNKILLNYFSELDIKATTHQLTEN